MPAIERDTKFWSALYMVARQALDALPYAPRPEIVAFPYEGEEWKEQAQIDDKSDECFSATEDYIRAFCQSQQWPQQSTEDTRYFVKLRLEWSLDFLRVLAIPWGKTGNSFLPRPQENGYEMLEWLLTDGYNNRFPPPPHNPMRFAPIKSPDQP